MISSYVHTLVFPAIDPIALRIGPVAIHWYGISYVVGILIAWWLLLRAQRPGTSPLSPDQIADLIFWAVLGMLVGGRLGFMLFYGPDLLLRDPLSLFRIHQGGMSFHGGLIGVLIGSAWFGYRHRIGFFTVTDTLAPVVPVGLFSGRLANFVNGELWGRASDLPWAMVFPDPAAGNIPRHPSQLYEAGLEGCLLFIILWLYTARPRPTGMVSLLFLALYGTMRFAVEFLREPDPHIGFVAFGWMTMGQALSLPMILIGAGLYAILVSRGKGQGVKT